jgi:hypothetical protein
MSKVAIKGAATGTGVFTLESPATNTDRTLVLPDEAGTVLTTAGVPASAMPAGSVIQVVSASNSTQIAYTTDADAVSALITVAANSRVVIMASIPHYSAGGSAWQGSFTIRLRQNGTQILYCEHVGTITNEEQTHQVPVVMTTGALSAGTYTFTVNCGTVTGGTHYLNRDGRASTLTLMEIAA